MERDLPTQANASNVEYVCHQEHPEQSSLTVNLNVRSTILQGALLPVISGGEFNSSAGDHNRAGIYNTYYLVQGSVQQHRDDRHESVSSFFIEQLLLR